MTAHPRHGAGDVFARRRARERRRGGRERRSLHRRSVAGLRAPMPGDRLRHGWGRPRRTAGAARLPRKCRHRRRRRPCPGSVLPRSRSVPPPAPRPASTVAARRKALESAGSRWGACIASPPVVVEQLLLLRHLVTTAADGERLGRLVDRVMLVATKEPPTSCRPLRSPTPSPAAPTGGPSSAISRGSWLAVRGPSSTSASSPWISTA